MLFKDLLPVWLLASNWQGKLGNPGFIPPSQFPWELEMSQSLLLLLLLLECLAITKPVYSFLRQYMVPIFAGVFTILRSRI